METSITDSMSKVIDTAVAVEGNNPDDEVRHPSRLAE